MPTPARIFPGKRTAAALFAAILLTGPGLTLAQAPLREAARMARAEGEEGSNLKAALAALASAVSGLAVGVQSGDETPQSP